MAGGAPGPRRGGAGRPPPDRLPPLARGRPARARPRAVERPVLVPARGRGPQCNPAWWPFGLPYWPLVAALRPGRSPGTSSRCCACSAPGCSRCSGCASSALSPLAAAAGGLAFEIAPYRLAQSRGHLLGPISLLLPLALWAFERARRPMASAGGGFRAWRLSRSRSPARCTSRSAAIPFYLLYAICRTRAYRPLFEASVGVVAAVLAGRLDPLTGDRGVDRRGRPVAARR